MKEKIKSLQKYFEIYRCIGEEKVSLKELQIRSEKVMAKSTSEIKIRDVKNGMVEMIIQEGDNYTIDYMALRSFVEDLCKMLGTDAYVLFSGPVPEVKGKQKLECLTEVEQTKESGQLKKQKAEIEKLKSKIKEYEKKMNDDVIKLCDSIVKSIDSKVLIPETAIGIGEAFDEDIFYYTPDQIMGKQESVVVTGGVVNSTYNEILDPQKDMTVKNIWGRIASKLVKSRFFEKRYTDEEVAIKENTPDNRITDNRRKSIENLLSANVDNQIKLALYAGMYEYRGTEMEDLLNFAGDKGLEANYVIRLLENPGKFNNYYNVRGFLRQVCKGSEARMKRVAAMELISGEWYVLAKYKGQLCKFQMVPVNELLEFRSALLEHSPEKVLFQLEKMLGEYRKASFVDDDPEKDIEVEDVGFVPIDSEKFKAAMRLIHQHELPSGTDPNEGMLDDMEDGFVPCKEDENV